MRTASLDSLPIQNRSRGHSAWDFLAAELFLKIKVVSSSEISNQDGVTSGLAAPIHELTIA